ncbi:MAG: LysE family translocator [Verrucomicrobium sp.]|nr:LysE family translocator [Verrucomicrobium sp.]
MSAEQLLGYAAFSLVAGITPGPNNAMLLSSGVHYGIRRTLPHMLGIVFGFPAMILVIGLGLVTLFEAHPNLYVILRYASAAYLLYLAWKIARAGTIHGGVSSGKPMTFGQAAAFQWINPKGWVMALSIVSLYTPHEHFARNVALLCALQVLLCLPCVLVWTAFGRSLRDFLRHPRAARGFNVTMALLLAASLIPIFKETAGK